MQQTYNITYWGGGYYCANNRGNISVCPNPDVPEATLDLTELVKQVQESIHIYAFLRCFVFHKFYSTVCAQLNAAFHRARESYGYKGDYFFGLSN